MDHNHKTEKFRGMLCSHCNRGLGNFKDNIEILEQAILYLKNTFESVEVLNLNIPKTIKVMIFPAVGKIQS